KNAGVGVRWRVVVGPQAFRAISLARDALYAVADLRARVAAHRAFHRPLIVVDEQPRWHEVAHPLLQQIKLQRPGDGVGRATTDAPLVANSGALRAKIDARRDIARDMRRNGI